jgi:hypothetical protein
MAARRKHNHRNMVEKGHLLTIRSRGRIGMAVGI